MKIEVRDGYCVRCGSACDGSLRRMHPRTRALVLAPEVPRFSGGGVALCWACQFAVYWKKGFNELLTTDLAELAQMRVSGRRPLSRLSGDEWQGVQKELRRNYAARSEMWERVLDLTETGMSAKAISDELGLADPSRVYDIWKKHGIPTPTDRRKESRKRAAIEKFGHDRARKVLDMRRSGQSWTTIAALMGEKKESVMSVCLWLGEPDGV